MSVKVVTNSSQVALSLDRKLKTKILTLDKTTDKWMTKVHQKQIERASSSTSPEKDDLASNIIHNKQKKEIYTTDKAYYAPFIEFGTKSKVVIKPKTLAAIASKYKGIPMDFDDVVRRIMRTEGKTKDDARAIASKIASQGTQARPFFFNSFYENIPLLRRWLRMSLRK